MQCKPDAMENVCHACCLHAISNKTLTAIVLDYAKPHFQLALCPLTGSAAVLQLAGCPAAPIIASPWLWCRSAHSHRLDNHDWAGPQTATAARGHAAAGVGAVPAIMECTVCAAAPAVTLCV